MNGFFAPVSLLMVALLAVGALYAVSRWSRASAVPLAAAPFNAGGEPAEHAMSRYHVRWYPVTMLFLAFDMEMVFMYPWIKVISTVGPGAVIEMFTFLAVLLAGVAYAWREGALRWT
ncbi:NADH-quinone oxidoreductase subunit A [Nonomuraea sp. NPDC049504]|uniref:NADH-quinone oxidoreductase subunit A n=1 Tax=Nonomuraea sp. NPDC049504 TaxID=3154729 RepID=UPI0034209F35